MPCGSLPSNSKCRELELPPEMMGMSVPKSSRKSRAISVNTPRLTSSGRMPPKQVKLVPMPAKDSCLCRTTVAATFRIKSRSL